MARRLHQTKLDRAYSGGWGARNRCPVNLARIPMPERRCQCSGHSACARHDKNARRILVEPMHKTRFFIHPKAQGFGQTVDMAALLASALNRQALRLVKRNNMVIAI